MPPHAEKHNKRPCGEDLWASRKEEILTQAALLFAKHGYSETDTQLLAETIGVGKGTVYRYFSSKREPVPGRRRPRDADDARAGRRRASPTSHDPMERITTGIRVFLAFFAEHPEFVELLIQERAQFKDRTKPTFMEHRAVNVERWRSIYRELIADGRVRDDADRSDHRRHWQSAVRHDFHQLFQRPDEIGGGAGTRHYRRGL